jgi:hypothetical protein
MIPWRLLVVRQKYAQLHRRAVLCHTDGALRWLSDVTTLSQPASGHTPDKRGGEKSSVDDLSTGRGVVSQ